MTPSLVRIRGGVPVVALIALAGCAAVKKAVKKPTISFSSMTLTSLTFTGASVDLSFAVDNPNIFPIPLRKYAYTVNVGDYTIFAGEQDASVEVPAQGRGRLTVPVNVRFSDVTEAVGLLRESDRWPYSVSGSLTIHAGPLVGITVPFSHRDTLPRPIPPSITVERLNVRSFGFTGIDMDVVLSVRNAGRIAYALTSLAGSIELNGQRFIAIDRLPERVQLGTDEQRTITIPVSLSASPLVQGLRSIISQGQVDYRLVGDAGLAADRFGTLPLSLDQSGTVRLFR